MISIRRLPQILVLQVKRFSHNSYFGSKLSRHVQFPIDHLDMSSYLSRRGSRADDQPVLEHSQGSSVYDLAAVIRHSGSTGNGHYVAYARNFASNRWFKFDDDQVREVTADQVQDQQAYVLVYERRKHSIVESQVPLRLVRQNQVPADTEIRFPVESPKMQQQSGQPRDEMGSQPDPRPGSADGDSKETETEDDQEKHSEQQQLETNTEEDAEFGVSEKPWVWVGETRLVSRLWLRLAQLLSTPRGLDPAA